MRTQFKYIILPEFAERKFEPHGQAGIESEAEKGKRLRPRGYLSHQSKPFHFSGGSASRHDFSQQFVILKANYRFDKDLHVKHLQYIQREGKGKDGQVPELYGNDPQQYKKKMAKLHYRFIVSPENQNVDLTLLAKEFIRQLEHRTGYEFDWVAAEHYNTGQKHAHILINGFDKKRRKIRFSRDEMKMIMRRSLRDIATTMIGPRTASEQEQTLHTQAKSNGYTNLDNHIKVLTRHNAVSLHDILHSYNSVLFHKRMMHLCKLGIASYNFRTELFTLQPDWEETLKISRRYNSYLEGLHFVKVHPSQYELHDVQKDGPISGVIVKKYFMQDNSNDYSVILRTSPTTYAFVPLQSALVEYGTGQTIHIAHNAQITTGGKTKGTTEIHLIS